MTTRLQIVGFLTLFIGTFMHFANHLVALVSNTEVSKAKEAQVRYSPRKLAASLFQTYVCFCYQSFLFSQQVSKQVYRKELPNDALGFRSS